MVRLRVLLALLLVGMMVSPAWAAGPTFRAQANTPPSGATTSITVNKPTGTTNDDILVFCLTSSDPGTVTPPSGWVEKVTAIGNSIFLRLHWKRASGEGASWTWNWVNSVPAGAVVAAFQGALASGDPFSFSDGDTAAGPTNTFAAVSGTTTTSDELLVHCATAVQAQTASAPSSGFTERLDGATAQVMLAEKAQAAAGATGSVTGSYTGTASATGGVLVGLKAAACAPVMALGFIRGNCL
jgi:hypothetical protein